jgi:hypothetical protein
MAIDAQHVLCALMNSFIANFLIRFRVNTHVTAALVSRLPVPMVRKGEPAFRKLAALSQRLAEGAEPVESCVAYARLQAEVARLYQLNETDLEHILQTFPLIPTDVKEQTLIEFRTLHG